MNIQFDYNAEIYKELQSAMMPYNVESNLV